ncbi:uncharacterized protein N7518_006769 [Penicillium psychrosexuale]|uniref:uncharacterized protein n=1 Tax=Penicillium psychrosexuale TaxID=1002107 RepID=UPI002544DD59|nr:uncharacterized protein N7518_006769 [Penicillium psychrosexuale]KAJ5789758.1 hypothetical protein N7518_006769 [Penicillium psychrosexuale]
MVDSIIIEKERSEPEDKSLYKTYHISRALRQISRRPVSRTFRQFRRKLLIKAFHYNNELLARKTSEYSLISDGILIYHTPPGHTKINGYTERSSRMIITYIQMLSIKGKLPKDL